MRVYTGSVFQVFLEEHSNISLAIIMVAGNLVAVSFKT
jgi:hypothetical protein